MTAIAEQPIRLGTDRLFFTGMAVAAALTVFVGFAPTYYLRGSTLPPLSPLVQVHGLVFTLWFVLFIAQTALVTTRRTDIHRRLGIAGAILAAGVFIVGVMAAIDALRYRVPPAGLDPRVIVSVPLGSIIAFAVLVTGGILLRHRTSTHKRLMLLATIALLSAAFARMLVHLGFSPLASTVGIFLASDAFVVAMVVYDLASQRRVHRATIWGGAVVVLFKPLLVAVAFTPPWLAFADLLR
jgi:hypothetical protein